MLRLIVERLVQMIVVLIIVTFAAFFLVNSLNGDIAVYLLGDHATPEAIAQLHAQLRLDDPILSRYLSWLGGLLSGDLGSSIVNHYPVGQVLINAVPPSLELLFGAQIVAIVLAVATTVAALRWRWADGIVTAFALLMNSIPAFVVGLLLIIVFASTLHLLPAIGWVAPTSPAAWGRNITAMILPSVTLGIGIFPGYMRVLRADLRDQFDREEYVTLARMKGIRAGRIFTRHVLPNSIGGFISVIASSTAILLGGALLVEQVFAIPGIGKAMFAAIDTRDTPVLLGGLLVIVTAVVVANLIGELIHMAIDPRVRAPRATA